MRRAGFGSLVVAVVLGQVVPGLGEGLRLLVEDGVPARAVPLPAKDVVGLLLGAALLAPLLVLGGVDEEDHVPLGFRVRHRGKVRGLGFRSTKRGDWMVRNNDRWFGLAGALRRRHTPPGLSKDPFSRRRMAVYFQICTAVGMQ
jgi:hypothetical protein